jgi:hypothetical protein
LAEAALPLLLNERPPSPARGAGGGKHAGLAHQWIAGVDKALD